MCGSSVQWGFLERLRGWGLWICDPLGGRKADPRGPPSFPTAPSLVWLHLLGHEGSASYPGVASLWEEQLRTVQHIHEHGELGLHHGAELLLQGGHDVLRQTQSGHMSAFQT